jgi:hypothetical protein
MESTTVTAMAKVTAKTGRLPPPSPSMPPPLLLLRLLPLPPLLRRLPPPPPSPAMKASPLICVISWNSMRN